MIVGKVGFRKSVDGWVIDKDPDSVLDYTYDWTNWLEGDSILTSTWSAEGLVIANSNIVGSKKAVVWLEGGIVGKRYVVVNTITTATRQTSRYFVIECVGGISE